MFDPYDELDLGLAELERLSNGVLDLIESGRLEEAERDCHELNRRFPDSIDWMDRSARVAEAKGESARAIDHYRRCIAFIDRDSDGFDEEVRVSYQHDIDRLEAR